MRPRSPSFLSVLTAAALLGLHASTLDAQEAERPDLTGTWALSAADSDFGMSPAPDSALMIIERADDHVVMTRTTHHSAAGGGNTTRFDMPADGESHEAITDDGATEASLRWDGTTLVLWVLAQSNVGDVDVTEYMSLDSDAGQLTVDREIVVPGMGEFEQTLVFTRR